MGAGDRHYIGPGQGAQVKPCYKVDALSFALNPLSIFHPLRLTCLTSIPNRPKPPVTMQLSSLFLSATALIAQAAAADYLLFPTIKRLEPYGAARIESSSQGGPWLPEHVGFPQNTNSPLAEIPLDQGDIGSKFYLQSVGDRKWALISRDVFHIPVPVLLPSFRWAVSVISLTVSQTVDRHHGAICH